MSNKRLYGLEAAAGGDVGPVDDKILGPCPSCTAELRIGYAKNPHNGQMAKALLHAVPFCSYYVKTDPAAIERDVERVRKGNR